MKPCFGCECVIVCVCVFVSMIVCIVRRREDARMCHIHPDTQRECATYLTHTQTFTSMHKPYHFHPRGRDNLFVIIYLVIIVHFFIFFHLIVFYASGDYLVEEGTPGPITAPCPFVQSFRRL